MRFFSRKAAASCRRFDTSVRRQTTLLADVSLTRYYIDRKSAGSVPEATFALCEFSHQGDEGVKPDLERAATWAQQSAEQGQFLTMIEWGISWRTASVLALRRLRRPLAMC
jgi:TPR repeat protein